MSFIDLVLVESGSLELTVDVARKNKVIVILCLHELAKDCKSSVRGGAMVQRRAVTVEAPSTLRILSQGAPG